MATEANRTNLPASATPARATHEATLSMPSTGADTSNAIGYEAADPALHAPLWAEAMLAGARDLR
ncbi:MAG TPA: hypothetical protein VGP22_07375 [Albitalea sp.]|nr:hypothetical protein [Albitalea sp.]